MTYFYHYLEIAPNPLNQWILIKFVYNAGEMKQQSRSNKRKESKNYPNRRKIH